MKQVRFLTAAVRAADRRRVVRRVLREEKDHTGRADEVIGPYGERKAASDAATSEAADRKTDAEASR